MNIHNIHIKINLYLFPVNTENNYMVKLRKTIFHNSMHPIISVVWIAPTISAITIIAHETWESIQNTYYGLYFFYCNKFTVESFRSIS